MAIQAAVRHGPAVTGLSPPRGKATHRTAQRGAINVRPGRCAVVMADKRLSGSSHSQPGPDTCVALRYVQSEGRTLTAEEESGCCEYSGPRKHSSTQTETHHTHSETSEKNNTAFTEATTTPRLKVFITKYCKKKQKKKPLKSGHICLCGIMTRSFGSASIFQNIL